MEFEERKKLFIEWFRVEYKNKLDELQCDFYHYPLFVPDGTGGFKIVVSSEVVDVMHAGMKSPLQP